jgi:predicted MFS family arabinose efflux permease
LLVLQLLLALTIATYAVRSFDESPALWFVVTAFAALLASSQDVFVDALAVRTLAPEQRGLGNVAQVAGYRLGMLIGGAWLLVLAGTLGTRETLLACAGVVAMASVGAFAAREARTPRDAGDSSEEKSAPLAATPIRDLARHIFSPRARTVIILALTYKLGLHMAGALFKPIVVDAHWTQAEIGWAVVTVGTVASLAGSAAGGLVHRISRESTALTIGGIFQAFVCVPLFVTAGLGAPKLLTTFAIGTEHFATGLGTTVLFAALMSATRPRDAGLHYTILTSANALAIGIGSTLGGIMGDIIGIRAVFAVGCVVCLAPLVLIRNWKSSAEASADESSLLKAPSR